MAVVKPSTHGCGMASASDEHTVRGNRAVTACVRPTMRCGDGRGRMLTRFVLATAGIGLALSVVGCHSGASSDLKHGIGLSPSTSTKSVAAGRGSEAAPSPGATASCQSAPITVTYDFERARQAVCLRLADEVLIRLPATGGGSWQSPPRTFGGVLTVTQVAVHRNGSVDVHGKAARIGSAVARFFLSPASPDGAGFVATLNVKVVAR